MTTEPPEARARRLLEQIQRPSTNPASLTMGVLVVGMLALCVTLLYLERGTQRQPVLFKSSVSGSVPRFASIAADSSISSTVILVQPGNANHDDLFLLSTVPTITWRQLTFTPSITETFPALDRAGTRIAYYGLEDKATHVYTLMLPDGVPLPITLQAGTSGLNTNFAVAPTIAPALSPDAIWVAFAVKSIEQNIVALCIARSDGTRVLNINVLDASVIDYAWIDNTRLIVLTRTADGTLKRWTARLEPPDIKIESQ